MFIEDDETSVEILLSLYAIAYEALASSLKEIYYCNEHRCTSFEFFL